MMKRTKRARVGLILCLSLILSMFSGISGSAKKAAKIKKIEVRNTDSGVLVMKKKERKKLKLAINGKVSKTAWKKLKFRSKNKKVVRVDKKGKLTAKKKGSSKITITAKGSKKKATLKVIVGTKIKSLRMNATAQTLFEGASVRLSATIAPKTASYKKIRWMSSNSAVATVANGQVRAIGAGTATITAMAQDGTRKTAVCQIVVKKSDGSSLPTAGSVSSAKPGTGVNQTNIPETKQPNVASASPTATAEVTSEPTQEPTATAAVTEQPTQEPTATPGPVTEKGDLLITKTIQGSVAAEEAEGAVSFEIVNKKTNAVKKLDLSEFDYKEQEMCYAYVLKEVDAGTYTVKEINKEIDGFVLAGVKSSVDGAEAIAETEKSVSVLPGKSTKVAYENTYEPEMGNLILTKTIKGDISKEDAEESISFTITNVLTGDTVHKSLKEFNWVEEQKQYVLYIRNVVGNYKVEETLTDIDGLKLVHVENKVDDLPVSDGKEASVAIGSDQSTVIKYENEYSVTATPVPTTTADVSPKPTEGPTAAPTEEPTAAPTEEPTAKPTEDPTAAPTKEPTAAPTKEPTAAPTKEPTAAPTEKPTVAPTKEPTAKPTEEPTAKPTEKPTAKPTEEPTLTPSPIPDPKSLLKMDCNKMTMIAGTYTGTMSDPFEGVKLYGNGDGVKTSYTFEGTNKKYRMILKGASTDNTAAGVSLYIGDKKKGAVSFTGTQLSEQTIDFKMQDDETGTLDICLKLETDNGSNDTCLQSFELIFLADIPAPPTAPVPVGGAAYTGNYRNMFKELGYSEEEINAKVEDAWQKFFYGTDEERIYYPTEDDMAYIYTADTNDVRSEGMSYGMMICVQMDKQKEFDRLWKWAKTYMQHTSGEFKDYFAWQCQTSGSKIDNTPAPDGEEYFATALLFASARWGDGEGIYDYSTEAQELLNAMYYHNNGNTVNSIFDATHKMPVFCPIGSALTHTDTSYHLPAFYEVWALTDEEHSEFWSEAAEASRQHFKDATNETTGLGPDYAGFDGTPTGGNHAVFRFDAWRIAGNIACDYAWWGKDNWATIHANRIQAFFAEKGVESYKNQWSLDGKELEGDHSPGLVAMNATASLAASDKKAWAFLEDFWNISPTTGKYRYYDGCLYMMGLLHCSGRFRAYLPNGTTPAVSSTIAADSTEFDKEETKQKPINVTMTLNGNTLTQIQNEGTALVENQDYTIEGDVVTIKTEYLAAMKTGKLSLSFVFSAGRKAVLNVTIKDTTQGVIPDPVGPFEQFSAASFSDSNDVAVQDGIVTFNSTDSWIAFDLDFGTDAVQNAVVYVKEPNNSGQVFICMDSVSKQVSTIYNLGNGSWKEAQNNCSITSGQHTVYVKVNKAGVQMEWIKFTKK